MPPVSHRTVVGELTPEQRAALIARSDSAGLRRLSGHMGAIGVCTAAIIARVPLWPIALLLQGFLLNFLFTALHETVHRTPFRSRQLNDWVGRVCAFIVLLSPSHFRHFHVAHHRYTNEPGRDPELAGPRPSTRGQYLLYLSGVPDWTWRIRTLARNAFITNTDSYVPDRAKKKVQREARLLCLLYVALAAASVLVSTTVLLAAWLLPLLLGGPFLRGYLLAEHARCPHVNSMFMNTRTTFTTVIVRFFAWNMPYHAEHHAFPAVPFHQLPAFHEHTKSHLAVTEQGYMRFNRGYLHSPDS